MGPIIRQGIESLGLQMHEVVVALSCAAENGASVLALTHGVPVMLKSISHTASRVSSY